MHFDKHTVSWKTSTNTGGISSGLAAKMKHNYTHQRVLAMSVSVYVCLSVTSRTSINTNEWIELVSGMRAFFHEYYTVLKRNPGIFSIKATSIWNIVPNSGLRKFRHGISIVERAINLAWERWTLRDSVINWTVVCQLKVINILPEIL